MAHRPPPSARRRLAFPARSGTRSRGHAKARFVRYVEGIQTQGAEHEIESYRARRFSGNFEFNTGGFYGGRRQETTVEGRWKANKHASVGGSYVNNRITFENRVYPVNEASLRLDFAANPTLFGALAAQWNDEDDETIVNFRLNWIPAPGSDVFLFINQRADSHNTFWRPVGTTAVSKLVWRIAF